MFFGLAVDPTDSKRLYWAACGANGGLHRSEDGGETWRPVSGELALQRPWSPADGTVYAPGKNLWRSTDHGKTWKQFTKLEDRSRSSAMERRSRDPNTMWFTATTWGSDARRRRLQDHRWRRHLAGDHRRPPYRKPMVLRFNPATNELWAGGVGLYKIKQ